MLRSRRAVETALQHPRSKGMSDRAIAEHCGVDHTTVARIRLEVVESTTSQQPPRTGRDGKQYKPHAGQRQADEAGGA